MTTHPEAAPARAELIERLRHHHEHPVTGQMVLINPDGPRAAERITELEGERDTAVRAVEQGILLACEATRKQTQRIVAAESALSLAESRGRQIGREEAWEGFESAPADGTRFDVWYAQSGVEPPRRIIDVYWSEIQDWWCVDGIYGPEEPTPLAMAPLPAYWSPASMPAAIRNLPTNEAGE